MYFELAIIFLIFVCSYFLILKYFDKAIYVLLILSVLLHKELFSFFRWDLLPIRAFMLALFCVGVTKVYLSLFKKHSLKAVSNLLKDPFLVLVIFLWLVRGLSLIFSKNLQASLLLYGFFTTIVVLLMFLLAYFKDHADAVMKYLRFYIWIVFGLTLFGYFQYGLYIKTGVIIGAFWNIPGNIARVGATFWDVNHYGALLASLIPIAGVFILLEKKFKKKVLYALMFLSMVVTLFLTNSRTAWMIGGFTLLFFISILAIKKIGFRSLGYILGVMILISIPLVNEYNVKSSPFRAKVKQYFHYRMDSFDSHILLLTGAMQVFEKYPVLGGGYGSFFEHFSQTKIAPEYFGRDPAAFNTRVPAHTIWGELMSETGVLGLSTFSLLIILLLGVSIYSVFTVKTLKEALLPASMFGVILGWMIAGIFYSYNSEFFWIILALFYSYNVYFLGKKTSWTKIMEFYTKSKLFCPAMLAILAGCLIFIGLGSNHLVPWDEAIYAKIAKNMVVTNDFIVQRWNPAVVWYEKPPFYMWTMAAFMKILGFNSWAAKLPSAIFGFATVLLVFAIGKKFFGKIAGFLSAFVLLTTTHFLYYSRLSMTDITATFFITLALFLYWYALENKKLLFWILTGVSVGFAVMTKGVIGLLPYPILVLYEIYLTATHQQKVKLSQRILSYITMFLVSAVIFMPWHLVMYQKFGNEFLNMYLGYHVISRAITEIEHKGEPIWWYVVVLRVSMRIWFVVLLGALPFALKKVFQKDKNSLLLRNNFVFLLIWSLFTFLFFSIAKSKLIWYIMPIYPALALLVGYFINTVFTFVKKKFALFNNSVFDLITTFILIVFSLTYLFYNRELVYPSDLSGSQAQLLALKDEKLGIQGRFFVDRVELPLVMFYTDSPFQIMDYSPEKGRIPQVLYDEDMIVLGKQSRFEQKILGMRGDPKVLGTNDEWVLWYYESEYKNDKAEFDKLQNQLDVATKNLLKNPDDAVSLSKVKTLPKELSDLDALMKSKVGKVIIYPPSSGPATMLNAL